MARYATRCGEARGNARWVGGDGRRVGEQRCRRRGEGGETSLTCAHFVGLLSPGRPDATRRSSGSSRIESARPSSVGSFSINVTAFSSSLMAAISRRA